MIPLYTKKTQVDFGFFDKHKLLKPDFAGWSASNAGSGGGGSDPSEVIVNTGTTANSRGLRYTGFYSLNSGDMQIRGVDFTKKIEITFLVYRIGSDNQVIARAQLKHTNTEGQLANVGLGIQINNYTMIGEAYGTTRGTTDTLITLVDNKLARVKIVHYPNSRVEFWVNGVLKGTLTGNAVPVNITATNYFVLSIINGAAGGVDAYFLLGHLWVIQEW